MFAIKANAQSTLNTALSNPVILTHYTADELQALAVSDSAKLNSIVYYYTQSYQVEPVECSDCLPFDPSTFDISRYEHLRAQDTAYTREFTKYGFRLTLFPVNSLRYTYPVHSAPKVNPVETEKH
jgi:hypothetical protein